jgi:hypothetical protein
MVGGMPLKDIFPVMPGMVEDGGKLLHGDALAGIIPEAPP